jgi:RecA-family ATPase
MTATNAVDPLDGLSADQQAYLERQAIQAEGAGRFQSFNEKPQPIKPVIHWAKEALEPQPEKEWIIRDLIGAGDVLALIGDAGSKKTWASLDTAVCVAMGKPWLDKKALRSRVLIVDEESGERRLKMRLGDCMRGHGAGADLPVAFTTMAGLSLSTDSGAAALAAIIKETDSQFIVMDALQDFTLGMDENSGQELAPVIHRLKVIAEKLNCAIWILHHVNKQGAYRGHSSIKGLIDPGGHFKIPHLWTGQNPPGDSRE